MGSVAEVSEEGSGVGAELGKRSTVVLWKDGLAVLRSCDLF